MKKRDVVIKHNCNNPHLIIFCKQKQKRKEKKIDNLNFMFCNYKQ